MDPFDQLPGIATLTESFMVLHEMFLSLMAAGFTEDQALRYIAYLSQGMMNPGDKHE